MSIISKKKIAVVTLIAVFFASAAGIYINPVNVYAANLPGGYTQIDKVGFNIGSNLWETMEIPFMLTDENQSYSWILEASNLQKFANNASLVGVFQGVGNKRSGYLFAGGTGSFVAAVAEGGTLASGSSSSLDIIDNSDSKYTITTVIDGTNKTFESSESVTGKSISYTYSYPGNVLTYKTFFLDGCANVIDGGTYNEFMSFYFYGVKIKDASGNTVVDMVPAKDSEGKEGAYDRISGSFYPKFKLDNVTYQLTVDNQGGIADDTYSTSFKNGGTLEDIPSTYIPVKQGLYFGGYYSGENGTGTKYFDINGAFCQGRAAFGAGNVTLYAYWTEKPPVSADTHECHFEWQVIERPTLEKDGLEGEVCTCGRVGMTQPLSAYVYALNYYATPLIESAKPGQTVVLELGGWNSFPKTFMEKVAAKSAEGVNFVFHYNWKNVKQEITIPAGKTFDLNMDWYGPATMNTLFGEL